MAAKESALSETPPTNAPSTDFHFSLLFADVWSFSLDLLNWFSRGVILFGLLSGRFGEKAEEILEILRSLGRGEEYDKMEAFLDDMDD